MHQPNDMEGCCMHIPYVAVIDISALFIFLHFIQNIVGYHCFAAVNGITSLKLCFRDYILCKE